MEADACVYAICGVKEIRNRRVKGFHLLRVGEDGKPHPWSILVVRWDKKVYGYVNACPHQGGQLDWERDQFIDPTGKRLICGKHGALFEIDSGHCVDGPCQGQGLVPVAVSVIDGDVCVSGVTLAEDDAEPETETSPSSDSPVPA